MREKAAADLQAAGGQLHLGMHATKLLRRDDRVVSVEAVDAGGAARWLR
jgi:hypothetical protein